jgi:hypothetical protein
VKKVHTMIIPLSDKARFVCVYADGEGTFITRTGRFNFFRDESNPKEPERFNTLTEAKQAVRKWVKGKRGRIHTGTGDKVLYSVIENNRECFVWSANAGIRKVYWSASKASKAFQRMHATVANELTRGHGRQPTYNPYASDCTDEEEPDLVEHFELPFFDRLYGGLTVAYSDNIDDDDYLYDQFDD